MVEIKVKELPSKIKEVKKDKAAEEKDKIELDAASLEALVQHLKGRAITQQMHASRPAVNPVLKQTNLAQEVARTEVVNRQAQQVRENAEARPIVYESRNNKTIYEPNKSDTSERKYQPQNSERKYSGSESQNKSQTRNEESRRVSPVLGSTADNNPFSQNKPFGAPRDTGFTPADSHSSDRDYEVNPLAENSDRKRSRRML